MIVASPPASGFNIGACVERRAKGMLVLGAPNADCGIERSQQLRYQAPAIELWQRIERESLAEVITFDKFLCSLDRCAVILGSTPLYVDSNHFTHEGFALLAEQMKFGDLIERLAR